MERLIQAWELNKYLHPIDRNSLRNCTAYGRRYWESMMCRDPTVYPLSVKLFLRYALNPGPIMDISADNGIPTLGMLPNRNAKIHITHDMVIDIMRYGDPQINALICTMTYTRFGWTLAAWTPSVLDGAVIMRQITCSSVLLASQLFLSKSIDFEYQVIAAMRRFNPSRWWMDKYPHPINNYIKKILGIVCE